MKTIKELRVNEGLSQEELAHKTNLSVEFLQELERGQKEVDKLDGEIIFDFCYALGCSVNDLVDTEVKKNIVLDNLVVYIADIEMDSDRHDDFLDDYDSELEFYISNVELESYLEFLTSRMVDSVEDAIEIQRGVIELITERITE